MSRTSDFRLNNKNNTLIDEAGSLCSTNSVDEENDIEEQSSRPIQHQIPESQRGKAKTEPGRNNLILAVKESFERFCCLEFVFEKSKHREASLKH